jgi:hypothetical protein
MPKVYCSCYVFDNTTKRNRKCKLKPTYTYENNKYCHVHIKTTNYFKSIIKIQSVYRGYLGRKLVKKYNTLPDEVQRTICKYVRQDIYYHRYCEKISTIIINKAINFMKKYYLTYPQIDFIQSISDGERHAFEIFEHINYLNNLFKEIIHIFYLIDKYNHILNISIIENYYFNGYVNYLNYNLKHKLIEMANFCILCIPYIYNNVPAFKIYNINCIRDLSQNLSEKY